MGATPLRLAPRPAAQIAATPDAILGAMDRRAALAKELSELDRQIARAGRRWASAMGYLSAVRPEQLRAMLERQSAIDSR
jgi:hypothetical protein